MTDINVAADKHIFEYGAWHWDKCNGKLDENGRLVLICYCGFLFRWFFPKKVLGRKIHVANTCKLRNNGGRIEVVCHCPTQNQQDRR